VVAIRDLQSGAVTELEATSRSLIDSANYHPRWSPDGQTIAHAVAAFGAERGTARNTIRLVGAEGANDRVLTAPDLEAGDPEWAPDGASL
jgi:Tol biopolymer transport system component